MRAQQAVYRGQIVQAQTALAAGDPARAKNFLSATLPHLRHWEYEYLNDLTEGRQSQVLWQQAVVPDQLVLTAGEQIPAKKLKRALKKRRVDQVVINAQTQQVMSLVSQGKYWFRRNISLHDGSVADPQPLSAGVLASCAYGKGFAWASSAGVHLLNEHGEESLIIVPAKVVALAAHGGDLYAATERDLLRHESESGGWQPVLENLPSPSRALSADGQVVLCQGGEILSINGQQAASINLQGVGTLAISDDGQYIACAEHGVNGNRVRVFSAHSGELLGFCSGLVGGIARVCFGPDGKELYIAESAVKGPPLFMSGM